MLGKYWHYITPEYLYYNIDIPDLRDYFALVPKHEGEWVYKQERKNNYSTLPKEVAAVKEG